MARHWISSAVAGCALSLSMAASAEGGYTGQATLANAVAAPLESVVAGVTWRCEADKCTGSAARRSTLNSFIKDCRKVAEAVGPLLAYTSGGRAATKGEIGTCNRLAGKS